MSLIFIYQNVKKPKVYIRITFANNSRNNYSQGKRDTLNKSLSTFFKFTVIVKQKNIFVYFNFCLVMFFLKHSVYGLNVIFPFTTTDKLKKGTLI